MTNLTRALGAASAERDAAMAQGQDAKETVTRLKETVASQTAVIQSLDDERAAAVRAAGPE